MPVTPDSSPTQTPVISDNLISPPGGETHGDRYIIAGIGGAWSGFTIGDVVTVIDTLPTAWINYTPTEGDEVYLNTLDRYKKWNGSAWGSAGAGVSEISDLTDVGTASPTSKFFLAGNGSVYTGRLFKSSDIDNFHIAIVDPVVTDDVNSGYEVLSLWLNSVTQITWVCVVNTIGAAVWIEQIQPINHRSQDQLVHNLAETSFQEIIRTDNQVTSVIDWTSAGKTTKVREETITRSGNTIAQIVTQQYDALGALKETLTEVFNRSAGKLIDITRTLS